MDNQSEQFGININEVVRVRLTKRAKAFYYDHIHRINKCEFIDRDLDTRLPPTKEEDENGFSEFQLWEFMDFFSAEKFGQSLPTEDGKIYFKSKDLSPLVLKDQVRK